MAITSKSTLRDVLADPRAVAVIEEYVPGFVEEKADLLGPVLGMSDVIVDIVETGTTLKENGLEVIEEFKHISARLICNKTSFKFKNDDIRRIVQALKAPQGEADENEE